MGKKVIESQVYKFPVIRFLPEAELVELRKYVIDKTSYFYQTIKVNTETREICIELRNKNKEGKMINTKTRFPLKMIDKYLERFELKEVMVILAKLAVAERCIISKYTPSS